MTYYITLSGNTINDESKFISEIRNSFSMEAAFHSGLDVAFIENNIFDYVVRINAGKRITEYYRTIYSVIKDILYQYHFSQGNIEIFADDFQIVCERNDKRFLSRKKVYDYLQADNGYVDISIREVTSGSSKVLIYETSSPSSEQFWVSVAKKAGYDEWDMTSMPFIPITTAQFDDETKAFIDYWQLDADLYNFINHIEIKSVLQNYNEWDCNEYH